MFNIDATINVADTLAKLDQRASQLPFAAALALTRTAQAIQAAEKKEMSDVFDRPTPWTLNSVAIQPATKTDLRAVVFLKNDRGVSTGGPADVYLTPQIRGGSRELKRFEYAFRSVGVLPSGHFMVPGQGARIDQYGNMAHGQIVQMLSYFQAFGQQGYTANTTAEKKAKLAKGSAAKNAAGFAYFAVQPGGRLFPGIYQRFQFGAAGARSGALKPVVMFVDSAHYAAIFDFGYVGQLTVERQFPAILEQATAQTLASAH